MPAPEAQGGVIYDFGDVSFDTHAMRISKAGVAVDLEPKVVDVLRVLLEHRDRLVTKEELLDTVWAGTFVTPNVLTRAVAQLRKGLGDDARESRYIETVTKRGYRFIGDVVTRTPVGIAAGPADRTPDDLPALPLPPPSKAIPWRALVVALVVATAGSWLWWRPAAGSAGSAADAGARTSSDAAPATVRRLFGGAITSYTYPALAPDGHRLAYVSDSTGSLEIYVNALEPGGREQAVTSDGGENDEPAWSPDGQRIAYRSRARGGIWVVGASGGAPRQVIEFGSAPTWSPDSQSLAFSSFQSELAAQGTIWAVRADGSARREVTTPGAPRGGHRSPTWSPDGRHIVFMNYTGGMGNTVWAAPADGGAAWQLVDLAVQASGHPRFSPDGRAVFFLGGGSDTNVRVYRLEVDASARPVGPPVAVIPAEEATLGGLSVGLNGLIAYAAVDEDSNLHSINWPTPHAPIRLTDGNRNFRPAFSPDGRRLAYVNFDVGQGLTVWVTPDGGGPGEMLLPGRAAGAPQWSADGRRILVRDQSNGGPTFTWVDVTTRRATPLELDGREKAELRLSPDGEAAAYHQSDAMGVLNLWTETLGTGLRRQLTRDAEAIAYPAWSPDGRRLAAEMKRGSSTHVVVVDVDTGAVTQLTDAQGQSWPNSWSPDGEWIAFAGERDSVWNVWAVSTRTRETRQLTRFADRAGYVRWPAWSPTGERIVFEHNRARGTIWTTTLR